MIGFIVSIQFKEHGDHGKIDSKHKNNLNLYLQNNQNSEL